MAYLKIVLVVLMLVFAVSAMRLPDQDISAVKRGNCKCDDEGPNVRTAPLTGYVDLGYCNEGWEKCASYYSPIAECCRKKKG
nr:RpIII [Heteractis magnifica]